MEHPELWAGSGPLVSVMTHQHFKKKVYTHTKWSVFVFKVGFMFQAGVKGSLRSERLDFSGEEDAHGWAAVS